MQSWYELSATHWGRLFQGAVFSRTRRKLNYKTSGGDHEVRYDSLKTSECYTVTTIRRRDVQYHCHNFSRQSFDKHSFGFKFSQSFSFIVKQYFNQLCIHVSAALLYLNFGCLRQALLPPQFNIYHSPGSSLVTCALNSLEIFPAHTTFTALLGVWATTLTPLMQLSITHCPGA